MSPKRLLPLVLILLVLGLLAVVLKRQPTSSKLADEVGLERLVPQTFRADAVDALDLFHGAQPQEVVRLRKRHSAWLVASRFEAPGNSTKIQQLLTHVSTLSGELRADSPSLLDDFRLQDGQAFHLKIYTANTETPALYLLAGKSSGSNGFMRRSGDNKVYSVNLNLQSLAGISSTTPIQPPESKAWLDLHIQNVPREHITAVELQTPTRTLRFTTQRTEADKPATPAWTLATPPLPYSVQSEAVETLVTSLRTVQGDDVADPAHTASYGLDTPSSRATLTVQASAEEARQITLWLGTDVPEKSGSRYARLGTTGPVYILPQWSWQRLFPALGTLLEIRLLQAAEADVVTVALRHEGETWELQRHADEASARWYVVGDTETPVDETAVNSFLGLVTQLTAEDIPPAPTVATGLEQPALQMTLTLRDGRTERLLVGQPVSQEGGGYYASSSRSAEVVILPATRQRNLTEAITKLKPGHAATAKDHARP